MNNAKILKMIECGQIETLKFLLKDEIYTNRLKKTSGARQRYSAMKYYLKYGKKGPVTEHPWFTEFEGEQYTGFTNGHSIVLTKESNGEIELLQGNNPLEPVSKYMEYDTTQYHLDFEKIFAEAATKGYKLKKSELHPGYATMHFLLHWKECFYRLGLVEASYNIIRNDSDCEVYRGVGRTDIAPMIIKNDIGICIILPIHYCSGVGTVIEAE